jgi:tRNA(fMet)-specific endonuclease VapC
MIVACELRFGAAKRGAPRLTAQMEAVLAAMEILPFDKPADHEYAKLRLYLERTGTPIGPNDMLIAAHALASGSILVTANTDEFARVPGLAVENWFERMSKR